jgi:hypothetical protein
MNNNEEDQKPKEVEQVLKPRDYHTKAQNPEKGSERDWSGDSMSGSRWAGRWQSGGRDR